MTPPSSISLSILSRTPPFTFAPRLIPPRFPCSSGSRRSPPCTEENAVRLAIADQEYFAQTLERSRRPPSRVAFLARMLTIHHRENVIPPSNRSNSFYSGHKHR